MTMSKCNTMQLKDKQEIKFQEFRIKIIFVTWGIWNLNYIGKDFLAWVLANLTLISSFIMVFYYLRSLLFYVLLWLDKT